MQVRFSDERVLAVVAHPDDAELLCAGTLARARDDGGAIGICVLCHGDKGQPDPPLDDLAAVRRREMGSAADLLKADLFWGGFPDGHLCDGPEPRRQLIEIYRRFRPTLVLAHWQQDYHADHRAAGQLAEAVSWFCASRGHATTTVATAAQPVVWWMDTVTMSGFEPHFFFDISEYIPLKQQMLACHASQLSRGAAGDFSPLAEQMLVQCRARGVQSGVAAAEAFRHHVTWKRVRAW